MVYYNIELIDVSDTIENFKFNKIKEKDLNEIIAGFKKDSPFIEFLSMDGNILLKAQYFRGIMFQKYEEKEKTTLQENKEAAKEVSKIKLKKTVFNSTGDLKHD